jgi:hypothetical protein
MDCFTALAKTSPHPSLRGAERRGNPGGFTRAPDGLLHYVRKDKPNSKIKNSKLNIQAPVIARSGAKTLPSLRGV